MNPRISDDLIPPRATRRIRIRPIGPPDYRALFELAIDHRLTALWRFRGAIPSYEEFSANLYGGVVVQFVVSPPSSDEVLGHVVAYNADWRNGYCYLAVIMRDSLMKTGLGMEAFVLFVNYVFYCWDFRKTYFEVPEMNFEQYASGEERGLFTVEGRLRDHLYFGGRRWDMLLLSITREMVDAARHGIFGTLVGLPNVEGADAQESS